MAFWISDELFDARTRSMSYDLQFLPERQIARIA